MIDWELAMPIDRRMFAIGAALLAGGTLAAVRQPKVSASPIRKAALEALMPLQVGAWRFENALGIVLPPPDALSDSLYSGLVTRTYTAPGRAAIMFLVAYSNIQDGMLQVHRPEVCYPAGGYALSPTRVEPIADGVGGKIPANIFSADGVSRTEQVLYWTRIGSSFPGTWAAQRLKIVEANLAGVIPDGALVRMSTLAPDMESALPDLAAFAAELIRAAPAAGRRLLAGVA